MAKKIKKLIPKEIKPALPALAAIFGPAALAQFGPAAFSGSGVLASLPARAMVSSALAQAATEGKIDPKDTLLAGGQAYLGQKLSAYGQPTLSGAQGPITAKEQGILKSLASKSGEFLAPTSPQQLMEGRFTSAGDALGLLKTGVKSAIPQASVAYSDKLKEMNEKALRDYEAQLAEQGILDKADRRNKIFGYFTNAGYDTGEVNSFLDKYGYAYGGRVGFENGGMGLDYFNKDFFDSEEKSTASIAKGMLNKDKDKDKEGEGELEISAKDFLKALSKPREKEFSSSDLMDSLKGIMSGYEMATGQSIMGAKPQPTRFGLAEGGIPLTQPARKTLRELIEAGMLEDEGEGILDLIKKNPGAIGGPIMPMKPSEPKSQTAPIQMMASSDRYTELVEQFMYEGYDYDTASEMAFKALQEDDGYAEGGMINTGGREMDMRGGGFIPIGAKERADDVPARLSKNEFVMTADAVRGAGNGSINKGAKRMYDLMNKLESKV